MSTGLNHCYHSIFKARLFLMLIVLVVGLTASCTNQPQKVSDAELPKIPQKQTSPVGSPTETDPLTNPKASPESIRKALEELRQAKDYSFKNLDGSPIPEGERAAFKGLTYFPVDLNYRVVCQLIPSKSDETLKMPATNGEDRLYRVVGSFHFEISGTKCSLLALKSVQNTSPLALRTLFVPFKDATSGLETYGAGRYLELEENETGTYVLDFNRAFSPFCAYNSNYSCPIPPQQNVLTVAIKAGEKYVHGSDGTK